MGVVVENIHRTEPDTVAALGQLSASRRFTRRRGVAGLLATYMRPIYTGAKVGGPALTVSVPPGDNWMIHVAAEQCLEGDVMVVAPTSPCTDGYFGDLLATLLRARGAIGLIIDAGVRDVADLTQMAFPVWSRCVSAQGTVKETVGNVNVPLVCAGQNINPGDVIVADDDGVVVVRHEDAADVAKGCRAARREGGRLSASAMRQGELGLDMNNMRPQLAERGLEYVSRAKQD